MDHSCPSGMICLPESGSKDLVQIFYQLGRFDLVTMMLAMIGVILAMGAICGFGYIRWKSSSVAQQTAERIARTIANEVANTHMQQEMPRLWKEYMEFLEHMVESDKANAIAAAQDDGEA